MSSCFTEKADGSPSEELDSLDQKIINTLQKIDNNFSEAHQASALLLGKVQQFEVDIKQVHNGLKIWKRFFHNFNTAEASDLKQKIDNGSNKRPISSISTMQGGEVKEEAGDDAVSGASKNLTSHSPISTSPTTSKLDSSDGGLNFSINMSPPKTTCLLRHRNASNNDNNTNTTTTFMNHSDTSYTGMNDMRTPSVSKRAKLTTCMYILTSLSNKTFFF